MESHKRRKRHGICKVHGKVWVTYHKRVCFRCLGGANATHGVGSRGGHILIAQAQEGVLPRLDELERQVMSIRAILGRGSDVRAS